MSNTGLMKKLSKKNKIDTVILGIVVILVISIIKFIDNKSMVILLTLLTFLMYFIQYQISKQDLIKSLDNLIDNEFYEVQKATSKVLQQSEKQRLLIHKYTEIVNNALQNAKSFKASGQKAREKEQNVYSRIQETYESSGKESKSLNDNILTLQNLKHKVQVIAELIIELTDYIKQIGSTVNIVENISEQTNMLALNAAVEAARAGEYGKGFAVVAGEIRKLADESKQATNKITSLVAEIEQTTSSTIMATEDGTREIEISVKYAMDINNNIELLVNKIKEMSIDFAEVIDSSSSQLEMTNDVYESIDNMQKSISEITNTLESNIENIRAFSEISTNIKDNIAN